MGGSGTVILRFVSLLKQKSLRFFLSKYQFQNFFTTALCSIVLESSLFQKINYCVATEIFYETECKSVVMFTLWTFCCNNCRKKLHQIFGLLCYCLFSEQVFLNFFHNVKASQKSEMFEASSVEFATCLKFKGQIPLVKVLLERCPRLWLTSSAGVFLSTQIRSICLAISKWSLLSGPTNKNYLAFDLNLKPKLGFFGFFLFEYIIITSINNFITYSQF